MKSRNHGINLGLKLRVRKIKRHTNFHCENQIVQPRLLSIFLLHFQMFLYDRAAQKCLRGLKSNL